MEDMQDFNKILKHLAKFISPIEEKFTGVGIPALFSYLATLTGAGVIITAPMGSGKTLITKIIEEMHKVYDSDHVITIQEFKKTDWIFLFEDRIYGVAEFISYKSID